MPICEYRVHYRALKSVLMIRGHEYGVPKLKYTTLKPRHNGLRADREGAAAPKLRALPAIVAGVNAYSNLFLNIFMSVWGSVSFLWISFHRQVLSV